MEVDVKDTSADGEASDGASNAHEEMGDKSDVRDTVVNMATVNPSGDGSDISNNSTADGNILPEGTEKMSEQGLEVPVPAQDNIGSTSVVKSEDALRAPEAIEEDAEMTAVSVPITESSTTTNTNTTATTAAAATAATNTAVTTSATTTTTTTTSVSAVMDNAQKSSPVKNEPMLEPTIKKEEDAEQQEGHSEHAQQASAVSDLAAHLAAAAVEPKHEDPGGADALSTLASAALGCNQAPTDTPIVKPKEESDTSTTQKKKESSEWYDVGIIRGTNFTVSKFYVPPEGYDEDGPVSEFLRGLEPDFSKHTEMKLESGTAYKFRIAAINSRGQGPWSEVSAFKTCLPGYPGAPSAIKISKSLEGAHLSWEPPPRTCGAILEYAVYLAVRGQPPDSKAPPGQPSQLAFVRVYCGATNQCTVGNASLAAAHIDTTTKPAIIFRIAARNDKGYGPATQVRWLQDAAAQMKVGAIKRGQARAQVGVKRTRDEMS